MFNHLNDTPVVVLYLFMTYGPGQAPTKLIPSVALALLQGERPRLSSGRHRSDWVYISDVIEGFVAAATVSGIEGKTIDLGSDTLTPLRDIVKRLVAIVGDDIEPEFGALPDRPFENTVTASTLVAAKVGKRGRLNSVPPSSERSCLTSRVQAKVRSRNTRGNARAFRWAGPWPRVRSRAIVNRRK